MEMSSQSLSNISALSPVALVPRTPDRHTRLSLQPIPQGRMPFTRPVGQPLLSPLLPQLAAPCPVEFAPGAIEPPQPAGIPSHTPSRVHADRGSVCPAATRPRQTGCRSFAMPASGTPAATPGAGPGGTHPSPRSCG